MKIELDRNDKISEVVSIKLILINALLLILILPSLPENGHFNEGSTLNGFESKSGFWVAFALALGLYVVITVISLKPELYKSRMTKNNLEEQYKLTSKMARTLKVFILLAFCILFIFMLQSARGLWIEAQPYLFILFFGLIISPCLYYAVKISKVQ